MTIDTSGKWWVGSAPEDIEQYLIAYTADAYPVHEFRLANCACGCADFVLEADDDEGVARRRCAACEREHLICDSAERWEDGAPEQWSCECGSRHTNVGVGFSLYPEDSEIKWLYIGCRCSRCGVLGCFAGWKVAYAPSRHLFDQV